MLFRSVQDRALLAWSARLYRRQPVLVRFPPKPLIASGRISSTLRATPARVAAMRHDFDMRVSPDARINAGDGEPSAPGSRRVPFKTSPAFSLSSSRGSRAHRQSRDDAGGWRQKPAGGSYTAPPARWLEGRTSLGASKAGSHCPRRGMQSHGRRGAHGIQFGDRVGVPRLGAMTATQHLKTAASLFETGPARESGASFRVTGGAG